MFNHEATCTHCGESFLTENPKFRMSLCTMCQDYISDCDSYQAEMDEKEASENDIYG